MCMLVELAFACKEQVSCFQFFQKFGEGSDPTSSDESCSRTYPKEAVVN